MAVPIPNRRIEGKMSELSDGNDSKTRRSDDDDDEENLETIITCKGDLLDPDFTNQFHSFLKELENVLWDSDDTCYCCGSTSDDETRRISVRKLEPWNSVRVTIVIAKHAAEKLMKLAAERNDFLVRSGILAVKVEGHEAISLAIKTRNGQKPKKITLKVNDKPDKKTKTTGLSALLAQIKGSAANFTNRKATVQNPLNSSPSTSSPSTSSSASSSPLQFGESSRVVTDQNTNKHNYDPKEAIIKNTVKALEKVQFRSPNVVGPTSTPVPKVPSNTTTVIPSTSATPSSRLLMLQQQQPKTNPMPVKQRQFATPYPFISMAQAAQTNRLIHQKAHSLPPPPPYPAHLLNKNLTNPKSSTITSATSSSKSGTNNPPPNVTISSPLLVNLLQNDNSQNSLQQPSTSPLPTPPPPQPAVASTSSASSSSTQGKMLPPSSNVTLLLDQMRKTIRKVPGTPARQKLNVTRDVGPPITSPNTPYNTSNLMHITSNNNADSSKMSISAPILQKQQRAALLPQSPSGPAPLTSQMSIRQQQYLTKSHMPPPPPYVANTHLVHYQQSQIPQQPPPPYPQSFVQQQPQHQQQQQQNFFDIPQQSGEDDCWNLESITPSLTSSDLDSIMPSLDLLPDVSGSILSDMELMDDVDDLVMDDLMSSTTQSSVSVKQSPPSQKPPPTPPLKPPPPPPPSSGPTLKPSIATSPSSHLIPSPQQQPEIQNERTETVPDVSPAKTSTVTTTTTTTTSPIATETSTLSVPISSPVSTASPVQSPACDENGIPITYTSKGIRRKYLINPLTGIFEAMPSSPEPSPTSATNLSRASSTARSNSSSSHTSSSASSSASSSNSTSSSNSSSSSSSNTSPNDSSNESDDDNSAHTAKRKRHSSTTSVTTESTTTVTATSSLLNSDDVTDTNKVIDINSDNPLKLTPKVETEPQSPTNMLSSQSPTADDLRVPPLHISLRGKNSVVVKKQMLKTTQKDDETDDSNNSKSNVQNSILFQELTSAYSWTQQRDAIDKTESTTTTPLTAFSESNNKIAKAQSASTECGGYREKNLLSGGHLINENGPVRGVRKNLTERDNAETTAMMSAHSFATTNTTSNVNDSVSKDKLATTTAVATPVTVAMTSNSNVTKSGAVSPSSFNKVHNNLVLNHKRDRFKDRGGNNDWDLSCAIKNNALDKRKSDFEIGGNISKLKSTDVVFKTTTNSEKSSSAPQPQTRPQSKPPHSVTTAITSSSKLSTIDGNIRLPPTVIGSTNVGTIALVVTSTKSSSLSTTTTTATITAVSTRTVASPITQLKIVHAEPNRTSGPNSSCGSGGKVGNNNYNSNNNHQTDQVQSTISHKDVVNKDKCAPIVVCSRTNIAQVIGKQDGRSPNSAAQGEDSGIESMDALSEKSPNQSSQSPHNNLLEMAVNSIITPSSVMTVVVTTVSTKTAALVSTTSTVNTSTRMTTVSTAASKSNHKSSISKVDGYLDLIDTKVLNGDINEPFGDTDSQNPKKELGEDSKKNISSDIGHVRDTVNNNSGAVKKLKTVRNNRRKQNLSVSKVDDVAVEVCMLDSLTGRYVMTVPSEENVDKDKKSNISTPEVNVQLTPAPSDTAEKSIQQNQNGNQNASFLEKLLVDIPPNEPTVLIEKKLSPGLTTTRTTRSSSSLNSGVKQQSIPTVTSSSSLPAQVMGTATISSQQQSPLSAKRKRAESLDGGDSELGSTSTTSRSKKIRKSSENAINLIKACIGSDDTNQSQTTTTSVNKPTTSSKRFSSSEITDDVMMNSQLRHQLTLPLDVVSKTVSPGSGDKPQTESITKSKSVKLTVTTPTVLNNQKLIKVKNKQQPQQQQSLQTAPMPVPPNRRSVRSTVSSGLAKITKKKQQQTVTLPLLQQQQTNVNNGDLLSEKNLNVVPSCVPVTTRKTRSNTAESVEQKRRRNSGTNLNSCSTTSSTATSSAKVNSSNSSSKQ